MELLFPRPLVTESNEKDIEYNSALASAIPLEAS